MSRTILLADDSVTIQKVVELTFMDEDYAVIAVSNGDDALTALADLNPDLVITDLHMPGAGGFEVCRQAKSQGLPVLLLVGTFEPFQQDEADAAGVDGVVKKPFDSQELLQRVGELMDQAEARDGSAAAVDEDGFEVEVSPWEDAADHANDKVDVIAAEGLISTDTIGAAAHGHATGGDGMDDDRVDDAEAYVLASEDADGLADFAPSLDEEDGLDPTESMPIRSPISERFAAISGEPVADSGDLDDAGGSHLVNGSGHLSSEDVDRVAKRVVELLADGLLREVAWEVVP
ncbi:MAG: response regulator, partial [Thermoanaerobaculia bacterium]|nr:response regulator [Thermoanaerobaculia bacterium]